MTATVVITTRNRRDELRTAVRSAVDQSVKPEVLVLDDGSTDGTSQMVAEQFPPDQYPQVRVSRLEQSIGLIAERNRGAELATGDVLFSIDDDAAFATPNVVEQTLADFQHRRVGAVAIPFINVNKENTLLQRAPADDGVYAVADYIGTAHAVRRDLFRKLGGYRAYLFHQGEERDLCIRMIDAGYIARAGRSEPIHHFESPRRDFRRMDIYGRRNDVLFPWYNTPLADLPVHLIGTTLIGLRFGFRVGRPWRMMHGVLNGYGALLHEIAKRKPVSRKAYKLFRKLRAEGPLRLEEIESMLSRVID